MFSCCLHEWKVHVIEFRTFAFKLVVTVLCVDLVKMYVIKWFTFLLSFVFISYIMDSAF